MPRFIYVPLNLDLEEIRLMRLLPGRFDDAIEVEIFHAPLSEDHTPDYEALSYVWGSVNNPKSVAVRQGKYKDTKVSWYKKLLPRKSKSSGSRISARLKRHGGSSGPQTLHITPNLFIALQHLRRPDAHRVLWIDAISINQEDIPERSAEVSRMGSIFSKARQVIVWLGPKSDTSDLALETLRWIGQYVTYDVEGHRMFITEGSQIEALPEDPEGIDALRVEWMAIRDLLNRAWFTRLWTYQEIKLSKQAIAVAGFYELPWETFRSSVYWMGAYMVDSTPAMLNVFSNDYIVNSIYPIIATLRERDSPVRLVQDTRHSFCSDPKDRIYGLLSMLPLKMRQGIHANYDNTQEEVYQAFAREHIRYSESLDILAACEFRESPNLPTWVPDFSVPKRSVNFDRAFGCLRRTKYFTSPTDTELPITGVHAGTIEQLGKPAPPTSNLTDVISLVQGWESLVENVVSGTYIGGGTLLDAFTQTLVCGSVKEHQPAGRGIYPTIAQCRHSYWSLIRDGNVDSTNRTYAREMGVMLPGRTFGTTHEGYMGAFPEAARIGDQIIFALGSRAPLLLRPVVGGDNHYQFVGECYIAGFMFSEALLGPLPEDWEIDCFNNDANILLKNAQGEYTIEDPRLGPLPAPWRIIYTNDTKLNDFWFENEDTGYGDWDNDPRLHREALVERGLDVREFILV
jgi:hypothetical protein